MGSTSRLLKNVHYFKNASRATGTSETGRKADFVEIGIIDTRLRAWILLRGRQAHAAKRIGKSRSSKPCCTLPVQQAMPAGGPRKRRVPSSRRNNVPRPQRITHRHRVGRP